MTIGCQAKPLTFDVRCNHVPEPTLGPTQEFSMIGRLIEIGGWLRRRAENVAVALLSLMFACFILQIFFRYVLNNPVGWSEEVIITTWLWTVLWGAAFILDESEEIRFDIIYSNISDRVRRVSTLGA